MGIRRFDDSTQMLDVENIFAVLCVSLLTLQPLINLKIFIQLSVHSRCSMLHDILKRSCQNTHSNRKHISYLNSSAFDTIMVVSKTSLLAHGNSPLNLFVMCFCFVLQTTIHSVLKILMLPETLNRIDLGMLVQIFERSYIAESCKLYHKLFINYG